MLFVQPGKGAIVIGSNVPSAPNPEYVCSRCGRNLGRKYDRLRRPQKAPAVYKVDGQVLCENCFFGLEVDHARGGTQNYQ